MKSIKFIKNVISMLVFISSLVCCNPAQADEFCEHLKEVSAVIMKCRQEGSDFSIMYSIAVKNDAKNGYDLQKIYVQRAYLYPRLYDMEAREQIIADFSNDVYSRCMQARGK